MTASPVLVEALSAAGLDPDEVVHVVRVALDEDLRFGPDVTTEATIPVDAVATADVVAREAGVVAGIPIALAVVESVIGASAQAMVSTGDGERVSRGGCVLTVTGSLRGLLTAERPLLNLLTHLCGVATLTRAWVDALAGTQVVVRDTRKTTPGLRSLEKYAVRCGGGQNHRLGLGDAVLVKDNHIAAAGGIAAALAAVREHCPDLELEVECDTVEQVREAVHAGAKLLLLDNMSVEEIGAAAALARSVPGVRLEASGGLRLAGARAVAATGVDFVAVGALTHSAPALDLGLDLRPHAAR